MPAADDDDDPLPSAYTSVEVTGVYDDVGKCKEGHKQMTMTDLWKHILKNPEKNPMLIDLG